jgi:hypothetical protein
MRLMRLKDVCPTRAKIGGRRSVAIEVVSCDFNGHQKHLKNGRTAALL